MKKSTKIYIAGHKGMVGSAVWRTLEKKGYKNLLGKTSSELDLINQQAVTDFYNQEQPEVDLLIGDPSKAKNKLGWVPEHDLSSLVKDMMQADVKLMQKQQYLKKGGFSTNNFHE